MAPRLRIPMSLVIVVVVLILIIIDSSAQGLMTTSRMLLYLGAAGLLVILYECLPQRREARRQGRLRRLRRKGLCIHCGYDLSGAAHAACPECGGQVADAPDEGSVHTPPRIQ